MKQRLTDLDHLGPDLSHSHPFERTSRRMYDTALDHSRGPVTNLEPLIVAVDAGGTSTTAAVATVPRAIYLWPAPGGGVAVKRPSPANHHTVGITQALAAIRDAVEEALAERGGTTSDVVGAVIGAAGVDRPADRPAFEALLRDLFPGRPIRVVNDAELVLAAGTEQGIGVALIAGTGSIAFGRSRDGRAARAGGWGPLVGDRGSGYAVGRAALGAVARATDGIGPTTTLADAVVAHFGAADAYALISHVYRRADQVRSVAALAPLVVENAEAGDAAAIDIIGQEARQLARAAVVLARRLGFGPTIPTAAGGGLLAGSALFRERVVGAAAAQGFRLEPLTVVREPVLGGLRLAAALALPDRRD